MGRGGDDVRRRDAAWLLGAALALDEEDPLVLALALDPARAVRAAASRASIERGERAWMRQHERAVLWAAERGTRAAVLAAWRHARALRDGIDDPHARALLHRARDPALAPSMRAWLEHLASWSAGALGWPRAIDRVERARGVLRTTTGESLRVDLVRWSRAALPPAMRFAAADEPLGAPHAFASLTASRPSREREAVVRTFLAGAYSRSLELRADDGRAWPVRAWIGVDGSVEAEDLGPELVRS